MPSDAPPVSPAVLDAWDRHIEQAASTPEGPSVQTLLRTADADDPQPFSRLLSAVADRCDTPAVQQAWAAWTTVTDREELRLRLEVLSRVGTLDPALHPFVQFFFRASDPVLYKGAAQALGRHLDANPDLRAYLQRYADDRGIDLDQPMSLNGERPRRRLLVALAAHRAAGSNRPVLDHTAPDTYLERSGLDLNAVMKATGIVIEGPTAPDAVDPEWLSFAGALLDGLADTSVLDTADPSLLRSWGTLLPTVTAHAPDHARRAWQAVLRRVLPTAATEEAFAVRLQRLNRIDEVIRSAARLPREHQAALLKDRPDMESAALDRFLQYRWTLWVARERTTAPDAISLSAPVSDDADDSVLDMLIRAETGSVPDADPLEDGGIASRRQSAFLQLCAAMSDPSDWTQRPVEQRALVAFAALDLSRFLGSPSAAVEATLDQFGFSRLRDPSGDAEAVPFLGPATSATLRLLARLSAWEDATTTRLVSTTLLHQVTDTQVLMMLLPTREGSEWTATLADAIEHQLRLRIRTRADARPEQVLYETTVRAPHPQFYEHLHQVCEGRTYEDTQGQSVPVGAIVNRLRTEARTAEAGAQTMPAENWPGDADFAGTLRHVRRTLTAVAREPSLTEGLDVLADILDPKSKDPATGSRGIVGLLRPSRSDRVPLVHRTGGGMPPSYPLIRDQLQDQVRDIREAVDQLQPTILDEAYGVRDDLLQVEEALDAVEAHVLPVIGGREATLLQAALRHLRTRLHTWGDALTSVHGRWQTVREANRDLADAVPSLLDDILTRDPGPIRTGLLRLLGRSLTARAMEERAWAQKRQLLETVVRPGLLERLTEAEQQHWTATFGAFWDQLLTAAMDAGHESRVHRLASADALQPLRQQPGVASRLETVREWMLDRYHLPAAHQVTRILQSARFGNVSGTLPTFFVHFSRVWLALLLGAVLMLDFGGAWTAMAAEGAVGSIMITFAVGVLGTLGYLFVDLAGKVERVPEDALWPSWRSRWLRLLGFLGICLGVTVVLTSALWFLLTGTGEVVEGPGAVLHITVWTGFALFVGVFFGLLAEEG